MEAEGEYCAVHEAIQVLQEKWTMHIVRALLDGPLGFNDLGRTVGGCNPATLKTRLDRLEDLSLLKRTVHSYMPPRTSYELAPAGVALQQVIDAIDAWGREHLPPRAMSALADHDTQRTPA
jgi:DNA-binding HxlR family transcriptional regulator